MPESSRNSVEKKPTGMQQKSWHIPFSEITLKEEIGRGAFGVVHKVFTLNELLTSYVSGSVEKDTSCCEIMQFVV